MENREQHHKEIISTRVGGFGGSDAAMFLRINEILTSKKISSIKELPRYICERLAVAKGLQDVREIPQTEAMKKGHDFEDEFAQSDFARGFEREKRLDYDFFTNRGNFNIFAHVDFYNNATNSIYELKCTSEDVNTAISKYIPQLSWEWMCSGYNANIYIVHKNSTSSEVDIVKIDRDDMTSCISKIIPAILWVNDVWDNIERVSDDVMVMDEEQLAITATFANYMRQIKTLEDECKKARARILDMMQANCATKIEGDGFTIQYIAPTVRKTFDVKALQKAYPDIDLTGFYKVGEVSASIKITLN